MKNECRLFGIIAIIAITGFSFVACPHDGGRGGGGGGGGGGVAPTITVATLPNGTLEAEYSQTLTATGDKPITWIMGRGEFPAGLILDGTTGVISGTPTSAKTYIFTVKAANAAGMDNKEFSVTIRTGPAITTARLPVAMRKAAYSQTLAATGEKPITWSVESGALPPGFGLGETTGVISGSTIEEGTFTFTVKAANAAGNDTKQFSITIAPVVDMVLIQRGTFTMGSNDYPRLDDNFYTEYNPHQVTLTKDFFMGKYPVTQVQYDAVMGSNPSAHQGADTANFPVEQVNWYEALVFCNKLSMLYGLSPAYEILGSTDPAYWLARMDIPSYYFDHPFQANWDAVIIVEGSDGYRLPTEAQWEYACRAGTTTSFNWGTNTADETKANYNNFVGRPTEVGSYAPNKWGLYDMHGNVREWCLDRYQNYNPDAQTDPVGPRGGASQLWRGGAYHEGADFIRSSRRYFDQPSKRDEKIGFRVVRPSL
jgi:formylglycine-generating enzyme required for sulfatase activity